MYEFLKMNIKPKIRCLGKKILSEHRHHNIFIFL